MSKYKLLLFTSNKNKIAEIKKVIPKKKFKLYTLENFSKIRVLHPIKNIGFGAANNLGIKNIVSSSYPDPTGSFQKTTYISSIGIYDEDKNLIAIAKVATPVKKTEDRELTFKLKLDI